MSHLVTVGSGAAESLIYGPFGSGRVLPGPANRGFESRRAGLLLDKPRPRFYDVREWEVGVSGKSGSELSRAITPAPRSRTFMLTLVAEKSSSNCCLAATCGSQQLTAIPSEEK